jgi:hypothetical protein
VSEAVAREELLLRLAEAGSADEIEAIGGDARAWLSDHPDDREVALAARRLDAMLAALREMGISELPPSTGAR